MRLREYIPYWLALGIFLCTSLQLSAQQPQPPAAGKAPVAPAVKVRAGFVEDSLYGWPGCELLRNSTLRP